MTANTTTDPTSLTQTFDYQSPTHTYTVQWQSLGSPNPPPLIFIHGTPWSSRVWVPFALALSRQFHVYLFDNPGFGDSPPERALPGMTPSGSKMKQLDADLARQSEVFAALFKSWEPDWKEGQRPHVVAHVQSRCGESASV